MHNLDLILTLAGGFTAALILGYLTQRSGLSPIVGYLLAGTLVGPHTPGFVANAEIAEQLAEVGVILLMFGVGLQFHIEELLAVRRVAIPGAIAQSGVATVLGAVIARSFGWDWSAGIVFGMALAVASTVVLIRVLADHRDLHTPTGHIAVGWLVVEDLFTVLALVLLPVLFADGGSEASILSALGITALKVAVLVAFTIVVGTRVIPFVLDHIADTGSRELFTLTVLTLALGIAVGSAAVFGVSMALGAFLAGLVVGRSDYSLRAASEALPMRDAFAVLFFVAVGMLLSPAYLLESPGLILATLAVVMIGKPLIALVVVRLLGYPFRVALAISVALAQIGEFSFILSSIGTDLGILPTEANNTLVAAAIVSIVLNPILYRLVPRVEKWVATRPRLMKLLNPPLVDVEAPAVRPARSTDRRTRAIVVGYGPTGRTVVRLLRDNGIDPTVIELNIETVRELRQQGIDAVYGDVTQRDTLEGAGADNADTLILTSAGMGSAAEVIRMARDINPRMHVLARAQYLRDLPALLNAGADEVFTGEGEVALSLTESILDRLGATPEQIDRERDRAHRELFGKQPASAATNA
ncbi:MAG: sodium:proton exchanger [Acidobacteria bacterium]|nr:MAG: sodium:proton exchanger [Acidobacteriota bacterium]